jgi:hypothetical protein
MPVYKVVFLQAGEPIGEYPVPLTDIDSGVKAAFDEFRRAFPDLSLFDSDIAVRFEKLEG